MHQDNLLNAIDKNLSNRDSERIISNFKTNKKYAINFIKHSSEEGVIRNGGRRGAQFAPLALLNVLKKMANHHSEKFYNEVEVSNQGNEVLNFESAQESESLNIEKVLLAHPANFHLFLGGGHDHIFPALRALENLHPQKKIIVVNFDPHLDMRTDGVAHSGTPFRQFDTNSKIVHSLIQIGSHHFANVPTSLKAPSKIKHKIISFNEACAQTENFTNPNHFFNLHLPIDHDAIYFFSLDIDALDASIMEAVSAVNHRGLPLHFIEAAIDYFKQHLNCQYFGFYEYNPIYDNLSQKGSRTIASLIYRLV